MTEVTLHTHRDGSVSQVVPVDELRCGDYLGEGEVYIVRIEEKPRTRVLTVVHAVHGFEDILRARRSSAYYVVPRRAFEVRAMRDHWGATIQQSAIERDLDEARKQARAFLALPEIEWAEVVEVEIPGRDDPDFEYVSDGLFERLDA